MDYSTYLFIRLLELYDNDFANWTYDDQYYGAEELYKQFKDSKFNRNDESEYDCIVEYLKNTNLNITK